MTSVQPGLTTTAPAPTVLIVDGDPVFRLPTRDTPTRAAVSVIGADTAGGSAAAEPEQPAGDEAGNATQPLSILIADDDPVIRSLTRDALEDEGYVIVEAENGLDAYNSCLRSAPGIVIADVMMPGLNGFDLCRRLRRRPETALVPILVATGLDDDRSIVDAYEAGASDFIIKPLDWRILRYRVRYMLRAAHAYTDLVAAKQRAEAADRAKSAFLANISHELRTPLNAVIGFSQILHQEMLGPLNPRYADYAKLIGESGSHLLAVINDLLDLAKSESGSLVIDERLVDTAAIVSFSLGMVEAMARDGGVACRAIVEPALPIFCGDAKKLRQVLINLLVNAIKFTPAGGRVTLRAARDSAGGLLLRVEDTGIGIAPDKIEVALTPFGQIPSEIARKHQGVGLGLPLAKRLVELHDGTLRIDSTPGIGTTITLRFPPERFLPTPPGSSTVN